MEENVKVMGTRASPFSCKVELALKFKGVEYEFIEEDLMSKSKLLVELNPVHKKIPVLVHNGKLVVESLVILEYIDETWKASPLLPSDPYERAQARFLAQIINDMITPGMRNALKSQGEASEKAKEQVWEHMKVLEYEIQRKKTKYLGGDKIGYLDIVGIGIAYWMPILQEAAGKDKELLTRDRFPGLCSWADVLLSCSIVRQNVPDQEQIVTLCRRFAAMRGYIPSN